MSILGGRHRAREVAEELYPLLFDPTTRQDGRKVVWGEAEGKHVYRDSGEGTKGEKGDPGQDGAPGKDGIDGATGNDGRAGATWWTGSGSPSADAGIDGDLYPGYLVRCPRCGETLSGRGR